MNEFIGADPAICKNSSELKLLLGSFGPYAGRYLANCPLDWSCKVEGQLSELGEVESARVSTLLRRARESAALVTREGLPWDSSKDWLRNARPLLSVKPKVFDGLVAQLSEPPAIHQLDTLDLPPTADERIAGTPEEYSRVAKMLVLLSPEVAFIDPYLDPLKRKYGVTLKALFAVAAKGKCQKFALWARASEVIGSRNAATVCADLKARFSRMASDTTSRSKI